MDTGEIKEKIKAILPFKEEKHRRFRTVLKIFGIVFAACLLIAGSAFAYAEYYKNKVYPGVFVGQYPIGGMTEGGLRDFIENFNNRIAKEGLDFSYTDNNNEPNQMKMNVVSADDSSVELVRIDTDNAVDEAMAQGRTGSFWKDLFLPAYIRFIAPKVIYAGISEQQKFKDNLNSSLTALGDKPHGAGVQITYPYYPAKYEIIPEKEGYVFDYDAALADITSNLSRLSLLPIALDKKAFMPAVLTANVSSIAPKLDQVLNYGDLNLSYINSQTEAKEDWNIPKEVYSAWIEVRKADNGDFVFALNKDLVEAYLEKLRVSIDMPAQNARFSVSSDKVEEFQASQSGISLDFEKTYGDLDSVFVSRNYNSSDLPKTVNISVIIVNPDVQMASINDLGITDILGVGISTFKDSHSNRIKNIANAVKRLNGILIKPGEEFSANKYAGPYTAENGFLPEQVIKGNTIKPEIGGGMCQIGTTLFRMAMNSGMDITERRNHSLVVAYYADPVNGNPGTDATLYEPDVDFKFINDTGNYLLLQTTIDYQKQQLTFTLWGKSDGRKGWYTHPIVSKWIPAGNPVTQVVTDGSLKPGEQKCQGAFRGAIASFTYSRITSSSEKIDRVFDSYYRPLPKICMVGATTTPAGVGSSSSTQEINNVVASSTQ